MGDNISTVGDNINTVEVAQYSGKNLKYYEFSKNHETISSGYFASNQINLITGLKC